MFYSKKKVISSKNKSSNVLKVDIYKQIVK